MARIIIAAVRFSRLFAALIGTSLSARIATASAFAAAVDAAAAWFQKYR